jgi:hypothetical protein
LIRTTSGGVTGSYKQEADLDLLGDTDGGWIRVGNGVPSFTGTFDGAGKGIWNIYINNPSTDNQGMFGVLGTNGTIRNVHIRSGQITGKDNVGGIVGNLNTGINSVIDCANWATVMGGYNIGGITGMAYDNSTFSGCFNGGRVSGTASRVGGIVGSSRAVISDCSNDGEVLSEGGLSGGVAGETSGRISFCKNTGTVTGNGAGGIAANNINGTIKDCSNSGVITGKNPAGGIVGGGTNGTITGCFNTGPVSSLVWEGSNIGNIGGVAGDITGTMTVSGCFNTAKVTGTILTGGVVGNNRAQSIIACYNTGEVSGDSRIGGVAGSNIGIISDCYNTGEVSGNTIIGGVVGRNSSVNAAVTASYNTGTVSGTAQTGGVAGFNAGTLVASYNTGAVTGSEDIGGIAGRNFALTSPPASLNTAGAITACYNTGAVTGGANTGGVVGNNYPTFEYSAGNFSPFTGTVTASYNTGMVSGATPSGGVVGNNVDGSGTAGGAITACYWQSGKGVLVGMGTDADTTASFSTTAFTPGGDLAWGTGNGGTNQYWKTGTTTGVQLPKLYFE